MIEEMISADDAENDGIPLAPSAHEALVRTARWANWAGVFMGGVAIVALLIGALTAWHTEQSINAFGNFHAAPGSRFAQLQARELLELRFGQVFVSGNFILMGALVAVMGWLALRFGNRLARIRYSKNKETLTAAAHAQRVFWRTQGVIFIFTIALSLIAVVIMGVYIASHLPH